MSDTGPASAGIVTVATGATYVEMAVATLWELRRIEPDVPVTLFVDDVDGVPYVPTDVDLVPLQRPTYSWDDKIEACRRSPYRKTVFLDSDVLAIRPFFSEVISALDWTVLLARSSGISFNFEWETAQYSHAIPQFNTGVIAFDAVACERLWSAWASLRDLHPEGHDQPTFRAAAIESGVVVSELPSAYNHLGVNLAVGPVRLLHCVSTKSLLVDPISRRKLIDDVKKLPTPCVDFERIPVLRGRWIAPEMPFGMGAYIFRRLRRSLIRKIRQTFPRVGARPRS